MLWMPAWPYSVAGDPAAAAARPSALNRLNLYVGRENVTTKTTSSGPQYQWVKLDEARSSKITAHKLLRNHSESCLIGGLEPWNIYDFQHSVGNVIIPTRGVVLPPTRCCFPLPFFHAGLPWSTR